MSTAYLQDHETLQQHDGSTAPWLQGLRATALERFRTTGFPTTRDEDWRFTNLQPITSREFPLAAGDSVDLAAGVLEPFLYDIPGASTLVFLNGRFLPARSTLASLPAGVTIRNLATALGTESARLDGELGRYARIEQNGFTALNTALAGDGLYLHVARDVEVAAPIHVVFATDSRGRDAASYPRNFIRLERGSRAAVIESYIGLVDDSYLTNAVTEAVVEEGAQFEHTRIQRESEKAFHIGTTHLHQGRDSRVLSYAVTLGGLVARNTIDMVLDGPGSHGQMLGFYYGRGQQEIGNHTSILHSHPNCDTREIYKGILDDKSHGIFNGKIYVTPDAQKTDAKQTNRALLLSDQARINTKPQLEIFADDVKCTHGATVGALDDVAAFYLKSRGIGPVLGRKILTYAFAAEVLEELPYAAIRESLEAVVMARLAGLASR
ncbi:MAG: Fe-S cluster assembly protein SufD [Gemmatimonadales bacterium]